MKIGVVGAGKIGAFHARTVSNSPRVDEVLMYDPDHDRAIKVSQEVNGKFIPDLGKMLQLVDAVLICSPAITHIEMIKLAIAAKTPTFCEKPLGLGVRETVEIVAEIESSTVPVMVGFQRRCDEPYREFRRLVKAGRVGRPFHWRMVSGDDELPPAKYIPTSGGIFKDQSIHDFDILRWISGCEVEEIFAFGNNLTEALEYERSHDFDNITATGRMTDGALFTLTGSRYSASGYDVRMEVAGSKGVVAVGAESGPITPESNGLFTAHSPKIGFLGRFAQAYTSEIEIFIAFLEGKAINLCTPRDALLGLLVAEGANRSLDQRRPILLFDLAKEFGVDYEA